MRKSTIIALCLLACMSASSQATLVFNEPFTYANGPLVGNGGWTTHSGTANQVDVASGVVNLTGAESEDVNKTFSAIAAGNVYAGVTFTFSALPTANVYFMHFMNSGTVFRGKVYATTTGAAAGTFRIGITDNSNTLADIIPVDIALNTSHRLVLRVDATTSDSTIFLDSATETGGTTGSDAATGVALNAFGLRQSANVGTLTVDNLIVATTYAEAVPESSVVGGLGIAMLGLCGAWSKWRKSRS